MTDPKIIGATALIAAARHGFPTDCQDLLVAGNPMRGIPPNTLRVICQAAVAAHLGAIEVGGFVVVPREVTEGMRSAFGRWCVTDGDPDHDKDLAGEAWRILVDAAAHANALSHLAERDAEIMDIEGNGNG